MIFPTTSSLSLAVLAGIRLVTPAYAKWVLERVVGPGGLAPP